MANLWLELKRRNVIRVTLVYIVVTWLSVQVADIMFQSFGTPDWVMKTFIGFLALGFPVAVVIAWAFEITPEGIKKEKDVDRSKSITHKTGRKFDYAIIGMLVLGLGYVVMDSYILTNGETPGGEPAVGQASSVASIAVLPFVNMSADEENEYFSDGISEELLNVLVRIEGLRVASRTSSFSFKGKGLDIPTIAKQLDVEHVLEGSVRKSGNRVRVTAQLIDVKTDKHLWSDTYDRELTDIFAIQDEIAQNIVEALKHTLGAGIASAELASTKSTDNMDAYQLYLQGRYLWQRRGEDNIRSSIELFKEAIDMDPGFARAWSNLAAAYVVLDGYSDETLAAMTPLALDAAEKAIELDPNLAEPYGVYAFLEGQGGGDWAKGEAAYVRALELEPGNATLNGWYGIHLVEAGYVQDAYASMQKAYELDPVSGLMTSWMGWIEYLRGDNEKAGEYAQRAMDLSFPFAKDLFYQLYSRQGRYEEAIVAGEAGAVEDGSDASWVRPVVEAVMDPGQKPQALAALRSTEQQEPDFYPIQEYLWLGEVDEAYRVAERSLEQRVLTVLGMAWDPQLGAFRQDPRFLPMMERIGITRYWDERGAPDLCDKVNGEWKCH